MITKAMTLGKRQSTMLMTADQSLPPPDVTLAPTTEKKAPISEKKAFKKAAKMQR